MIAYPAVDLRSGNAVQLVGGQPAEQRVAWPDPVAVALRWIAAGFQALHIVDLDAALGTGDNRAVIRDILGVASVPVQVGGGIRDSSAVADLIGAGAARVIVGTRAVTDAAWCAEIAAAYPNRIVVAADVRGDLVVAKGWTEQTGLRAADFVRTLTAQPLAAILITDVEREGQMVGVDTDKFAELIAASGHDIIAAGGVRDSADVRALEGIGAAGVVLGMALYTGAIDLPSAVGGRA